MDAEKMKVYAAKVAALLAHAESTHNDGEAQAYYAKAARLMMRHNIDQTLVDSHKNGQDPDKPDTFRMWMNGAFGLTRGNGAYWVSIAGFGDTVKWSRSTAKIYAPADLGVDDKGMGYVFSAYGFASDFQSFQMLWNSIDLQAAASLRRFNKKRRAEGVPARHSTSRSYLVGYFTAVATKIQEERAEAIEETSFEGVVALRNREDEVVSFWRERMHNRTKARKARRASDLHAYNSGQEDGQKANIGSSSNMVE